MTAHGFRIELDGHIITRFLIKEVVLIMSLFLLTLSVIFVPYPAGASLYGVVSIGENCLQAGTGCTDAGKLVKFPIGSTVQVVGDTGLSDLSALAFDPINSLLIAATTGGKIYTIHRDSAVPTKIVNALLTDPDPPDDIKGNFLGPRYLTALDVDPFTGLLYGVVNDTLGDYLVRLDLNKVDSYQRLEVEVIGVIGSTNFAYPGAPFGFTNVHGIAFNFSTGELFGTGIKQPATSPFPYLIKINTTHVPLPGFASEVGEQADKIQSYPRALAALPAGYLLGTGLEPSTLLDEMVSFDFISGRDEFVAYIPLDGQVKGLAFVTDFPVFEARPPAIISFGPRGGNPGIHVWIKGSGFTQGGEANVKGVYFNGVSTMTTPVVLSDNDLLATVPYDASTGPVKVVTFTDTNGDGKEDEAISSSPFTISHLIVLAQEVNQGIPTQRLIAGKDTLIRLLVATDAPQPSVPMPVTFGEATLRIVKPDGQEVIIPATYYTQIFSNSAGIEPSERFNINFYVSGDNLDSAGIFQFEYEVRGFNVNGPGPVIYSSTTPVEFFDPPGKLRVLYVVACQDASDMPEVFAKTQESILKVFNEASRVLPVRNGVGGLGDESAGVQIEWVGGIKYPSWGWCGNFDVQALHEEWQDTLDTVLEKFNSDNCGNKKAEYIMAFVPSECIRLDIDDQRGGVAWGATGGMRKKSLTSIVYSSYCDCNNDPQCRVALCWPNSKTPIHELGHCMGQVSEGSPNIKETDVDEKKNHSKNDSFPVGSNPSDIRAFNVAERKALDKLPRSVMYSRVKGNLVKDGEFFYEDFEYNNLATHPRYFGKIPDACPIIGCSWPFCSEFYIVARIEEDGFGTASAEVIQSYIVQNKPSTEVDPYSPYSLVFLDEMSNILSEDPFPVSFGARVEGESGSSNHFSEVVSLTRPLPAGTAKVQIRKAGRILSLLNRSFGIPTITQILSPSSGDNFGPNEEVTIQWTAQDPDGDPLLFSVSYSPNPDDPPEKVRWLPIGSGISATSISWNTSGSPGTSNGKLRIMVTDGFNASVKDSAAFSVGLKPPMVSIVSPHNERVFQEFDSIVLKAIAFDPQSGKFNDSSLSWSSTNRTLGAGHRVVLGPGTFSGGNWPISLTVTDGNSTITKMINITVLADSDIDGLSDDFEDKFKTQNPFYPYDAGQDVDGDGLSSSQEAFFGSDPENPDTDGDGYSDVAEIRAGSDPFNSNSIPNHPPSAEAGPDQEASVGDNCRATVTLNGTGSIDPDGDALTYTWTGSFGSATGPTPTISNLPLGAHTIILTVDDGKGGIEWDRVLITVKDTTPPVITQITTKPNVLWPPQHKMVPVTLTVTGTDNCAGAPVCKIISVSSNEPINGIGDGDTAPDWQITGNLTLNLRAERSGTGKGRLYTITVKCSDASTNIRTKTVGVSVPHNK
jgi:hypothetical protein